MNEQYVYRVRVSAAILRAPGQILMVKQRHLGIERTLLPGGTPRIDETLEDALVREIAEETRLEIAPTEIAYVLERRDDRWAEPTLEICFYANVVGESNAEPDPEILEIEWVALQDKRLLAHVPDARGLENSSRGRYFDASKRGKRK